MCCFQNLGCVIPFCKSLETISPPEDCHQSCQIKSIRSFTSEFYVRCLTLVIMASPQLVHLEFCRNRALRTITGLLKTTDFCALIIGITCMAAHVQQPAEVDYDNKTILTERCLKYRVGTGPNLQALSAIPPRDTLPTHPSLGK